MSAESLSLTPQEAIARDRIVERVAAAHRSERAPRHSTRTRRHVRAALLLRSLAQRLDPVADRPEKAALHAVPAPHAGSPRPWTAAPRRAPHRHS
ncbi:hypothetical protein GCM10009868_05820 [Terrabacter aerolatus]|uniref:Uncharacterized protein n=1 Tax=Terrabacter aerolatus TaxID=422442 RepID=A0A512D0U6_9MICO|nr:hypothetical protein [Terrabacter aerolatus]GEO30089.1 hypothetical protein TAE01_18990 [Terrabacter aerolatus]